MELGDGLVMIGWIREGGYKDDFWDFGLCDWM